MTLHNSRQTALPCNSVGNIRQTGTLSQDSSIVIPIIVMLSLILESSCIILISLIVWVNRLVISHVIHWVIERGQSMSALHIRRPCGPVKPWIDRVMWIIHRVINALNSMRLLAWLVVYD